MRILSIAVVGAVLADISVRTPRLPTSGENLYVHDVAYTAGGKGSNAAVTFARHGARVHLISNVGRDAAGEQLQETLRAAGVDCTGLGYHDEVATGSVVMLAEDSGETCYLAYPGASRTLTSAEVERRLGPLLPGLDALYLNLEASEEALLAAARLARRVGLPLFVDAGPERPMPAVLWAGATLLSPNLPEAAVHSGLDVVDTATAAVAARALLTQGAQAVVIKMGGQGALWCDAQGSGIVPAFSVPVVDPAGAGDAFTAGLTWAMLQGQALPDAVRWANACGAVVVGQFGTMPAMPRCEEVAALLAAG